MIERIGFYLHKSDISTSGDIDSQWWNSNTNKQAHAHVDTRTKIMCVLWLRDTIFKFK